MSSLDIKHRNTFFSLRSLRERSYAHITPRYVLQRVRHAIYRRNHPDMPDLTEASIALLSQLLRKTDAGAEYGAGNSTAWLAKRSKYLTSFETNPAYAPVVRANLAAQGVANADLNHIPFDYIGDSRDDELKMHDHPWLRSAERFADNSLDYALVDSAPRGCLCWRLAGKIKDGGLLILDNAEWYFPPPQGLTPKPPAAINIALGYPGSRLPHHICWPKFIEGTKHWRHLWTSNGVSTTLIMVKTCA
jgi:predicted O-methyltransferase YrrM